MFRTAARCSARSAAASRARGDVAAAIADFTHAIDLEPTEPAHYFDRAITHLRAREPVLAMADLNQTLKLRPDHAEALVTRGELFLGRRDRDKAKADFEAARRLAGGHDATRLRIAADYMRADFVDESIGEYDGWIADHPRDQNIPQVLNDRCYARALANRELDKALADCNAAIRGANNSSFLDSRGLVYLRMNQLDKAIADYDEALRRQPRAPAPLYGRGLAKVRKGKVEEGRAEMQTAIGLQPELAIRARRFGLTE